MSNVIKGRAAHAGMSIMDVSVKSGIKYSTLCKHASAPEFLRIWELSKISNAVGGLTLDDLAELGIRVRR